MNKSRNCCCLGNQQYLLQRDRAVSKRGEKIGWEDKTQTCPFFHLHVPGASLSLSVPDHLCCCGRCSRSTRKEHQLFTLSTPLVWLLHKPLYSRCSTRVPYCKQQMPGLTDLNTTGITERTLGSSHHYQESWKTRFRQRPLSQHILINPGSALTPEKQR